MTENETKGWLEYIGNMNLPYDRSPKSRKLACDMAIKALEEIQQYRAIGTIEDFKALKEKKNVLPIATIKISKEDMQKMVDEKVAQIELDIQEIRAKAINDFANWLYENHKHDLTDYIEWYLKETTEKE
jgi:hypothetical protein